MHTFIGCILQCVRVHSYTHTCIHAYIHTCTLLQVASFDVFAYTHTCIHTYMHTCTLLQVASFDVFAPQQPVESWDLQRLLEWERLITYGRPGWSALFQASTKSQSNAYDFRNLMDLAKSKLLGGFDTADWPPRGVANSELLEAFKIALLSRRALVRIGMMSQLARTMVASCMSICLRVSSNLESMLVDSLSEPILSEAAARLINQHNLWPALLESLLDAMRYGAVETGRLGELAAWILLAIGWDAACIAKDSSDFRTYTRSDVTLEDLLRALLGSVPVLNTERPTKRMSTRQGADVLTDDKAFVEELMQRRVCFTHVTQLQTSGLSMANLRMTASRSSMAVCPPGTDAIDGFIPLYPPKEKAAELWAALLQIKNKKQLRAGQQKHAFKDMAEVAQEVRSSAGQRSPVVSLPGIDILVRFGDESQRKSEVEFFKYADSSRACLLLSSDSKLSLFHNAFLAVSQTSGDADRLSAAFARLVDAERSAFLKSKTWSAGTEAKSSNVRKAHTLESQMESLTDVFIIENRTV